MGARRRSFREHGSSSDSSRASGNYRWRWRWLRQSERCGRGLILGACPYEKPRTSCGARTLNAAQLSTEVINGALQLCAALLNTSELRDHFIAPPLLRGETSLSIGVARLVSGDFAGVSTFCDPLTLCRSGFGLRQYLPSGLPLSEGLCGHAFLLGKRRSELVSQQADSRRPLFVTAIAVCAGSCQICFNTQALTVCYGQALI
jgi:hypothetical protein